MHPLTLRELEFENALDLLDPEDELFDELLPDADLEVGRASGRSRRCRSFTIDSASYVRWVQRSLNRLVGSRLPIDGRIGASYRAAVRRFQQRSRLRATGEVDRRTQDRLIRASEKNRTYVRWIQRALNVLGAGLVVDGLKGSKTKRAISKFQKAPSLELCVDGFVGPKTELRLIQAVGTPPPPLTNHHHVFGQGVSRLDRGGTSDLEGIAIESEIIGTDSRRQVSKLTRIDRVPFRWICSMTASFPDPDDPKRLVTFDDGGTGLLISSRHVLTAGHVAFAEITGSKGTKAKQWARSIRVSPGRNGKRVFPFGRSKVVAMRVAPRFRPDLEPRFDYALLKLEKAIGDKSFKRLGDKPLGFWGSASHGRNTHMDAVDRSKLAGKIVNVAGYPRGKKLKQWRAFDKIKDHRPKARGRAVDEVITYLVDTTVGQSGAPVWQYRKKDRRRDLVAVHHGNCSSLLEGCLTASGRRTANMGVLLTQKVIDQINDWQRTM